MSSIRDSAVEEMALFRKDITVHSKDLQTKIMQLKYHLRKYHCMLYKLLVDVINWPLVLDVIDLKGHLKNI